MRLSGLARVKDGRTQPRQRLACAVTGIYGLYRFVVSALAGVPSSGIAVAIRKVSHVSRHPLVCIFAGPCVLGAWSLMLGGMVVSMCGWET